MGASITIAGQNLIAQKLGEKQLLTVARFVLANVPGLNPNSPVDRAAGKPQAGQIVYSGPVTQAGYVNPNQVIYSLMLGSDIGDWDFNWIGLETTENVLLAVAYVPTQQKRKNIPPLQVGNNVTRNFLVVFDGAQALTGLTVDASTWQHDFTVRLAGIDERERLSNRDVYGRACFFGSALQLEKVGAVYQLKPGTVYVEGIRVTRAAVLPVKPPALPTTAWLDVALARELNDMEAKWDVVWGASKADYTDSSGRRHYLVPLADLPSATVITDRRHVEPIATALIEHFAARKGDYPELRARATTKVDVGLGNLPNAKSDDASSNSSEVLASTKMVTAVRVILQAAINGIVSGATVVGKAAKLATARTINGVAFDGSANITIADNTKLPLAGGVMTGLITTKQSVGPIGERGAGQGKVGLQVFSTGADNGAFMAFHRGGYYAAFLGLDTDNKLKYGGWSAGDIAYEIFHDANAASKTVGYARRLTTPRTINGVPFDGSANITVNDSTKLPLVGGTLTGNVVSDGHDFIIRHVVTTGGWARGLRSATSNGTSTAGFGFLGTGDAIANVYMGLGASPWSTGNGIRVTAGGVGITGQIFGNGGGLTNLNAANLASGILPDARLSGTYTGVNITGNAATSTRWATPRTLTLTGDAVGSATLDGTSNVTLNLRLFAEVGQVAAFATAAAPSGWLKANGAAVSRATYATLFARIGIIFGAGNGSTTFNLPDLRGEFVRGWDDSRGVDPGRGFATYQADLLGSHSHSVKEGSAGPGGSGEVLASGDDYTRIIAYYSTTLAAGGSETRPRNRALLYCIKY